MTGSLAEHVKLRRSEWTLSGLGVACVLAVLVWIDLSPRVESDFFFSQDDPQLQAVHEMDRRFPTPELIIVKTVAPDVSTQAYRSSLRDLTAELDTVTGVAAVHSVTTDDPTHSPLWQRLLLNPDERSTNIIINAVDPDPADLVPRLEAVWAPHQTEEFQIIASGVPYVIELIRRNLLHDLILFSSAAFVIFGTLVAVVYRKWRIVLGTVISCLTACAVTVSTTHLVDIKIGLLTANIAVIVFVLTLSHIVFLTSNWKQVDLLNGGATSDPVKAAVSTTFPASFWCMLTTLLGFLSLLIASARPLRELGIAGAIGTVTAIAVAYGIYPTFLRGIVTDTTATLPGRFAPAVGALLPERHGPRWLVALAAIAVIAAFGLRQFNTDPSLLSYFAPASELRQGLETIDRDGGSSPLDIAIRDPSGLGIDTDPVNRKMWALQELLEHDPSVGVVISPAVLLAHARLAPLGGLLNWSQLLGVLESPVLDRVGLSFVTPDREQGRYFLRMREAGRREARADVVARLRTHVEAAGLEADLLSGLYELQGQLGQLIAQSLRIGLGGLLLLFVGIAFLVSRSARCTVAMVACLCTIPAVVLGTLGHLRMPVDIITSPAANVALAMGVDSMIHLVTRVRRYRAQTLDSWQAWRTARTQLWQPVLGAALIVSAGFGIFSLSAFPPTQRFGLAVIMGTLTAAVLTLVALPFAAATRRVRC